MFPDLRLIQEPHRNLSTAVGTVVFTLPLPRSLFSGLLQVQKWRRGPFIFMHDVHRRALRCAPVPRDPFDPQEPHRTFSLEVTVVFTWTISSLFPRIFGHTLATMAEIPYALFQTQRVGGQCHTLHGVWMFNEHRLQHAQQTQGLAHQRGFKRLSK